MGLAGDYGHQRLGLMGELIAYGGRSESTIEILPIKGKNIMDQQSTVACEGHNTSEGEVMTSLHC